MSDLNLAWTALSPLLQRCEVVLPAAPAASRVVLELRGEAIPDLKDGRTRVLGKAPGILGRCAALEPQVSPVEGSPCLVIWHPEQHAMLVGMDRPADGLFFAETVEGVLRIGLELRYGLAEELPWSFIVGSGSDAFALLEAFGECLSRLGRPIPPPAIGWNSWDYYAGAVTMDDLRREMAAMKVLPFAEHVRHVVIDMGWEERWGEWIPNRKFPADPKAIASEIRAAGFVPGIWLAPLQVSIFSTLARHRQDLLVQVKDGGVYITHENALLDPRKAEVLDLLREWFGRLRLAGFLLFKVDFIYRSVVQAIGAGAVRQAFVTMREAIGEDAHLLNCGGPVDCTLGLVDSSRVTTDFHTFWGHIRHNAAQLASRYWQNGRLWRVDPDFSVVRCRETSDDPYLNFPHARRELKEDGNFWMAGEATNLVEQRTWLTLVFLSAGNIFLSDSLPRLNSLGIETLSKLVPPLTESARPVDLWTSEIPRVWLAERYLGVFNWSEERVKVELPSGLPASGCDVWTGERIDLNGPVEVAPHAAWLVEL